MNLHIHTKDQTYIAAKADRIEFFSQVVYSPEPQPRIIARFMDKDQLTALAFMDEVDRIVEVQS